MKPRNTKIICTIGPSTAGVDNILKLLECGMDTARLNFSHGTHQEHLQNIRDIRRASEITGKQAAIIQDLQGPKIRTGLVKNGSVLLENGQKFIITIEPVEFGTNERVSTSYKELVNEIKPGNTVLLDDGYIILQVTSVTNTDIIMQVIKGGVLKDHKGIIAPGVSSSAPSLSKKDIDDLKFGLEAGVDAVAISFVRSERDVMELKAAMKIFGRSVPIISKIERYEGYEDIDDIIRESDAIMIARGDLGLEMPAESVPVLQKEIIKKCNFFGKPVITATQMLESMIKNPLPTRAEASDVANAVLDGSDCVMLSGETSVGAYPFDAVNFMDRIIRNVEQYYGSKKSPRNTPDESAENISDALGKASCVIAEQIGAAAIILHTSSGYSARNIAKYRPNIPIVALADCVETMRNLSYVWGVRSILVTDDDKNDNIFKNLGDFVKNLDYIRTGDNVVFVAGLKPKSLIPENMIKIQRI